ncbi:MAG: tetratricopeptide repeat protein [Candidatus Lernaella stagnicola]|nr:tetratricopeptide repeat protein [Candidatus Lernaella stagnicola]
MTEIAERTTLDQQLRDGSITSVQYREKLAAILPDPPPREGRPNFADVQDELTTGKLARGDFARVNWRKKDLSGARLAGVDFTKAKLGRCNLREADLAGALLSGTDLSGADLSGAVLLGADLSGANLKDADLTGAVLDRADAKNVGASGAKWIGVSAIGTDFTFADMPRAEVENADFREADFTDANFADAKLTGVNWNGATLTRTTLQNSQIERFSAVGASAERINLNLAAVTDADFTDAELVKGDISNAFLERVSFKNAKLTGAIFNVSEHREVTLEGADLTGASLKSMVGYSEEELAALAERGAKVDKFLLRRFLRLLWRSRAAQAVAALLLIAAGVGIHWYINNPVHWSYAKLERVAQERRGNADFAGAEELYRVMLSNFSEQASKVAAARNALARLLIETKRFEESENLFNSVIADFPDQTGAVLGAEIGIADILREQKQYEACEHRLLATTDKFAEHPQVIDAWDRLAQLAKLQGRPDRAREIYEQVIGQTALDENTIVRAQFELAQMLHDNKDYDGAITKYREIAQRFQDDRAGAAALSSIIQIEVERQELQAAALVLEELKRKYPEETDSVLDGEIFYGSAMLNDSNFEREGLRRLQKIFEQNPTTDKGYWSGKGIAEYYKRVEKYEQALQILAKLQENFSGNVRHRIEIIAAFAEIDLLRGQPEQALERLQAVTDLLAEPGQARIVLDLQARALAASGQVKRAQITFRRLAELFPEDVGTRFQALIGEARLLATAGETEQAVVLYRQAADLADQPLSEFDALQNIAALRREVGNWDAEERELRAMEKRFAETPIVTAQVMLLLAENQRRVGKADKALELLRRVAEMEVPNRPVEALQAMLQIYSRQGDADRVAEVGAEIQKRFPQDRRAGLTARIEAANLLVRQGKNDEAKREYEAIAAAGESNFRRQALLALLQLHVDRGETQDAERFYETIKQEFPAKLDDIANATLVYAQLLRKSGRGAEAEVLYDKLIAENAGQIHGLWALAGLAQFHLEQNRTTEAAAAYRRMLEDPAAKKHPEEAMRARQGLGMIAETARDHDGAVTEYRKALDLAESDDDKIGIEQAIVRALAEQGNVDEAEALITQMKQRDSQQVGMIEAAQMNILGALARDGRIEEALTGYERIAAETDDDNNKAAALNSIAQIQLSRGRLREAETAYGRLRREFADDPLQLRAADLGLAGLFRQRGDFKRALTAYRKVVDRYDDSATRRQGLAAIAGLYAEMGELDKARETYQALLDNAGESASAQATAMMGLADLQARGGEVDKAMEGYRQVLDLAVEDTLKIGAYHALAQLYMQQGLFTQAREIYEELGQRFPQNAEHLVAARFGEAETLRQNGQYEKAAAIYNELRDGSANPAVKTRARISIGRAYLDQQKFAEARQAFAEVVEDNLAPALQKLEARTALADLLRRAGEMDAAADAYEKIVAETSDENVKQGARQAIAGIRLEQNRLDEAEKIFRAMSKAPGGAARTAGGMMGLADVAMRRGEYEKARGFYRRVRQAAVDVQSDLNALTAIAQSYTAEKKFARAEAAYDEILEKHGSNAQAKIDAQLAKANLLRDRGDVEEALGAYREIADTYGNANQVYWALSGIAQIEGQRGSVDLAQQAYDEIARRFPENAAGLADAKLNQANMFKATGRRTEAEKEFREIIETYPGSRQTAAAVEGLAQIGIEYQDYDQALQNFQKLLEDFSSDPSVTTRARLGLANVARQQGETDKAVAEFEKVAGEAKRPDDQVQALVFLAQTLQETGRNQEAEAVFDRLMNQYSDRPWARSEANMGRGNLRMTQGRFQEAADLFKKVAEEFRRKPMAGGALQAWASAEIAAGNIEGVETIITRIENEHGDDPNAAINVHMNVANKLIAEKQFAAADQRLARVLERYKGLPQTAWVRHAQAQSALAQRRFGRATEIYREIKEEFSGNLVAVIDAELGEADLLHGQGETDRALEIYERVANRYRDYSQAVRGLQAMADIYGERGRTYEQEQAYQRIVNEHPGDRETLLNARLALGNLYRTRNLTTKALEQYKAIYENHPSADQAAWAKGAAARLYYQIGEEKVAVGLIEEVINGFPEDHEAVSGAKQFLEEIYKRN